MSKHVQFYGLFLCAALFAGVFWSILVYIQLGVPTESSRWIHESIIQKTTNARKHNEPKILIVAGSSALFGVNAKTIEHELNIPTINMAVSAGLQLNYILEQTKSVARPGDIILLPLEYSLYDDQGAPDSVLIDYVFSRDSVYLQQRPILEIAQFVFGADIIRLTKGLKNKFVAPDAYSTSTYKSWTLNENGDETNNKYEKSLPREAILRFVPLRQLTHGIGKESKAWSILDSFVYWCRQHNIAILVTYPPILYNNAYFSSTTLKTITQIDQFWQKRGIKVLGKFDEVAYGPEYIYDTAYHLNDLGTKKRTKLLVDYLKDNL
jgi:hypothetical protein